MSINTHEVYITCPKCGHITTLFDYHENTSSEREELFAVLNIGPKSSGKIFKELEWESEGFHCLLCDYTDMSFDMIFTDKYCKVENLDKYKKSLREAVRYADKHGNVSFSDWSTNHCEEPALSRLICMYPDDEELKYIQKIYARMHLFGKRSVTKVEINEPVASKEHILLCEALERVYLTDAVNRIESQTFENCKELKDIFIPDSVTEIGEYAFSNSGLSKIRTSKNIKKIGVRAFFNTDISSFFIPEDTMEIGDECFVNCIYLRSIYIPSKTLVGKNAFLGCKSLKTIEIPSSTSKDETAAWGLNDDCEIITY